ALASAKDTRTFAVNHFYGNGPLVEGRMDPLVSPGAASGHVHTIQGGSNFALTLGDTTLLQSTCTSSLVKDDKSDYWTPKLYFQDPTNYSFISVPMFYMNVYYFFEATDDVIKAFEPGHRMLIGDPTLRTPPATGGVSITDTNAGTPQPVQWTCPRSNTDVPTYPPNSDGLHGVGIGDPNNKAAGVGFPDQNCDGFASPLRADIHFPSCYHPAAGLDNYKQNMQFPSSKGTTGGKQNCPPGWVHTPHIFYEVYWNTPLFKDLWTPGQGKQPFVLANGDPTGYSLHADFISGWNPATLQQIIDNCNAGDAGMDKCPGLMGGLNDPSTSCNIKSAIPEVIGDVLDKLPGNNPVTGWGVTAAPPAAPSGPAASSSPAAPQATPTVPASKGSSSAGSTPPVAPPAVPSVPASKGSPSAASPASSDPAAPADPRNMTTSAASSPSGATTSAASPSSSGTSAPNGMAPGWKSIGCYSDIRYERVLSGITFADLGNGKVTSTGCVAYCDGKGFRLAGTEFGGQCFCGNALVNSTLQPDSSCDMKCEGDASQICGGGLTLSVYSKNGIPRRHRRSNARVHAH
ncbi:hypothetical protein JB92DRAFT_2675225, partial [Gautieria morchelliformis]